MIQHVDWENFRNILKSADESDLNEMIRFIDDAKSHLNDLLTDEEIALLTSNRKIEAIKSIRSRRNLDLRTAKEMCDYFSLGLNRSRS